MIPVLKVKLPDADALLPYIRMIDASRWYVNFGPQVLSFQERVAPILHANPGQVLMIANGTLGITVALQSQGIARGTLCLMPSWTFTATPAAALAAGLQPCFLDVDKSTQALTPEYVKSQLPLIKKPVGAVIVVSPFGAPLDIPAWDAFTSETRIPVVVDAAAGFDTVASGLIKPGLTPIMVSLHATKILGIGEGGLLITQNEDIMFRARRIINFGFEADRLSHRIGINAKPSEYAATMGMAALDQWPETRAAWVNVQGFYRDTFAQAGIDSWMHPDCVSTTCNIIVPGKAVSLVPILRAQGIDTRRWWENGCHTYPAYQSCPVQGELENTRVLSQNMLALPCAVDMLREDQQKVCEAVIRAM
jgi:dTDP-4-amino-4,6-dideoxygalactose transaminase